MATLDIFILAVLGIGLIRGLRAGFLKQLASLIGTVLAFVLAASFMESAGRLLELEMGLMGGLGPLVAFIAIFVLVKMAVHTVSNAAKTLLETAKLSGLDRLAGGITGSLKAAILMSLAFLMIGMAELPGKQSREDSELYQPVYRLVPDAWRFLSNRAPAFEDLRQQVEDRLDLGRDSLPI
jgi:membrane protein required for colicin V production